MKSLDSIQDLIGHIARWAARLPQYDFDIMYRPEKINEDRNSTMLQKDRNNSMNTANQLEWQNPLMKRVYNVQYPYLRHTIISMDNPNKLRQRTGEVFPRTTAKKMNQETEGKYFLQQVPGTTRSEADGLQIRIRNLPKSSYAEKKSQRTKILRIF